MILKVMEMYPNLIQPELIPPQERRHNNCGKMDVRKCQRGKSPANVYDYPQPHGTYHWVFQSVLYVSPPSGYSSRNTFFPILAHRRSNEEIRQVQNIPV